MFTDSLLKIAFSIVLVLVFAVGVFALTSWARLHYWKRGER